MVKVWTTKGCQRKLSINIYKINLLTYVYGFSYSSVWLNIASTNDFFLHPCSCLNRKCFGWNFDWNIYGKVESLGFLLLICKKMQKYILYYKVTKKFATFNVCVHWCMCYLFSLLVYWWSLKLTSISAKTWNRMNFLLRDLSFFIMI